MITEVGRAHMRRARLLSVLLMLVSGGFWAATFLNLRLRLGWGLPAADLDTWRACFLVAGLFFLGACAALMLRD